MLDIIIVSYNTKDMTLQCIDSVKKYTTVPYHLIVVDNASTDGSIEALREIPSLTLIENQENLGYGKACNQGANVGTNNYIIFLNSDIVVTPNWARPLINCLKQSNDIAVVSPKLTYADNRINGVGVIGTNAYPVIRGWGEYDNGQYNRQIDCVSVCGAAFMIKRSNIPILGLFDERYFFYFEETAYCYNARDKGYRVVYCPNSHAIHYHQGSCKDNNLLMQYFNAGKQIFDQTFAHMMSDQKYFQ